MYNNEEIGISAEIAIADIFNVDISNAYRYRGNCNIINTLKPVANNIFHTSNIPRPIKHIAEGQNPIDFLLVNDKTLSVKTNQRAIGKVAPQRIGQPTAETFFEYLDDTFRFDIHSALKSNGFADTYANRAKIFKKFAMKYTTELLREYWSNLFDCDYLVFFYNILTPNKQINNHPDCMVFTKSINPINWDKSQISFTQTLNSWNESCTVKYYGISIGEFQVHTNRNCFKFRFNMSGILHLITKGLI